MAVADVIFINSDCDDVEDGVEEIDINLEPARPRNMDLEAARDIPDGPEDSHGFKDYVKSTQDYIRRSKKRIHSVTDPVPILTKTEYPELTCQHLLAAFSHSGVTWQRAYQLGFALLLAEDMIQTVEAKYKSAGPAMFAMQLVNLWMKVDPKDSNKETFTVLEEKLRQVDMNRVVGKLRQLQNSQGVAPGLTELVGKVTKDIGHENAIDFGRKLGLHRSVINEVLEARQMSSRDPGVAMVLYKEAERRNTFLCHSFVERVTKGLMDVCTVTGIHDDEKRRVKERAKTIEQDSLNFHYSMSEYENTVRSRSRSRSRRSRRSTFRSSRSRSSTSRYTRSRSSKSRHSESRSIRSRSSVHSNAVLHSTGGRHGGHLLSSTQSTTKPSTTTVGMKQLVCNKQGISISICVAIILLILIIATSFLVLPELEQFPKQIIMADDTILYPLTTTDTIWLQSLEFHLFAGESDTTCSAEVLSIHCDSISISTTSNTMTTSSEEMEFDPDNIYLPEGASIVFSTHPEYFAASQSSCSPTYIWVFTDRHSAEEHLKNNFESLACSSPPDGIICVKFNATSQNNVSTPRLPKSSYYFMRCTNGDPYCTFLSNMTIRNYAIYDFEGSMMNKIDYNNRISTGPNGQGEITFHKNQWIPDTRDVCVLARLSKSCQSNSANIYADPERSRAISYYLYIFCAFCIILAIELALLYWVCTKKCTFKVASTSQV